MLLRLALIAIAGTGLWLLASAYPAAPAAHENLAFLIGAGVVLALGLYGRLDRRGLRLGPALRHGAIWIAIVVVLVLGFTFQDELRILLDRVRAELDPSAPMPAGAHELVLTESADGHFYVMGEVGDVRVRFLVDTGASTISLGRDDARRIGIDVDALHFTEVYRTANGYGRGAPYILPHLAIGPLRLSDVPVSINQAEPSDSLLGMSFLKEMASFEFQGRKLILRWRD